MEDNIVKRFERILYIDPNDVFDKEANNDQKDLSLTPKYEDFCISFNLIIEQFSRFKSDGVATDANGRKDDNGQTRKYVVRWGLTQEELVKRRTSVLQGNRGEAYINEKTGQIEYPFGDSYNYLTTYFTDLTYDSYGKSTQIEGLGVENVQISYESWYTPTVTIKFVDVRGSAIFGREEAIHVDSQLMAENVFGAFFSMPYPLFRLQVKGFFGKPVTYQLTCSSFKGEFNAQTGNFEAVATFIGYSWSLLTDIPFAYIVAAPYATYKGIDYWERHKDSEEWQLWNDSEGINKISPPKLYRVFENIKNAIKTEEYGKPNEEQSQELSQMGQEKTKLNDLSDKYTSFLTSLKKRVDNHFIEIDDTETHNTQLLLFSDDEKLAIIDETRTKFEEYYNSIKEYQASEYKNGTQISTDKSPNKWKKDSEDEQGMPKELAFKEIFKITLNNNSVLEIQINNETEITKENLLKLEFNDTKEKLSDKTAEHLFNEIQNKNPNIKQYCYLVNLYDVLNQSKDRQRNMEEREKKITEAINENAEKNIIQILGGINNGGFKPFIGNVFKIIFCHLETLCHIMFDSADEIYAQMKTGKRKPEQLGIEMSNTDIQVGVKEDVTPWPALYNTGVESSECGYKSISDQAKVYAWPGDFGGHNFIEEQVVYGLQEGIQLITADSEKSVDKVLTQSSFPILPTDFLKNSVFSSVTIDNIPTLAGHLANRMSSIIGVLCGNNVDDNMCTTFGKLDAYNLYSRIGSVATLGNLAKDLDADKLEKIMYCDSETDDLAKVLNEGDASIRKFEFETARKISDKFAQPIISNKTMTRHPFFVDDKNKSDKVLYVHFYDKNFVNYVPSTIKGFDSYKTSDGSDKGDFTYNYSTSDDLPYFIPKVDKSVVDNKNITNAREWLHVCDPTKIDELKSDDVDMRNYTNKNMFNIITDDNEIKRIKDKCDSLLSGNIKVMEYDVTDDLNGLIDNFFVGITKNYYQYFEGVTMMLSGNADKLRLDKDCLLSDNEEIIPKAINYNSWFETSDGENKNRVKVNENLEFTFNNESISFSDLVIQEFRVIYNSEYWYNLFGCPFYYLQNSKFEKQEEKDDENLYNKRVLRGKAYLFLSTFQYGKPIPVTFHKSKKNGVIQAVPKAMLLFYGAILWRKRFNTEHKYDPIVTMTQDKSFNFFNKGVDYTFIAHIKETGNNYFDRFCIYNDNEEAKKIDYFSLSDFIGKNDIDYNIENQLISLFEDFVDNTFSKINSKYELKRTVDGKILNYTAKTFKDLIKTYDDLLESSPTTVNIPTANMSDGIKNAINDFINNEVNGLRGNYTAFYSRGNLNYNIKGIKLLLNENNKEDQELFKDLYFNPYIIVDNCYKTLGKDTNNVNDNDKVYVSKKLMKSYLKGFVEATKNIVNSQSNVINNGDTNLNVSSDTFKNRDLSLAIYYYLKNLWDKWLVISKTNAFDVGEFFKNFIFIDSFYINIVNKLAINCEMLLKAWVELADNGSLFHFLSQIVSKHGCIFLPVPDFVAFDGGQNDDDEYDIEMMKNLFRPLPYNSIEAPSNNNKFIVMYTHSPAHVKTDQNAYVLDSYDIWSHKDGRISDLAKALFKDDKTKTNPTTRYGYHVPSFGVAFAKQNNHIFKNLKLTMDNPVMTEQAIKAQWQIAVTGGSSEAHSIHFIGQDTFNVFSNYSYSITVDMMGNAQICPLMYFQLLNVPLWKGTYMIYKVVHNMTPGDMTTTVTAMKMSRFAQPFNTRFFTMHNIKKAEGDGSGLNSNCGGGGYDNNIYTNNSVGLVGDSYAVGMSSYFINIAKSKNINASSKPLKGKVLDSVPKNDNEHYSVAGARTNDIYGIRNAVNDGNKIIIIHLGLNSSYDADTIQTQLESVVDVGLKSNAYVYLCVPICPPKIVKKYYDEMVKGIVQASDSKKCGLIDLRDCQDKITNFDEERIHPSGEGFKILAQKIIDSLINGGIVNKMPVFNINSKNDGNGT